MTEVKEIIKHLNINESDQVTAEMFNDLSTNGQRLGTRKIVQKLY